MALKKGWKDKKWTGFWVKKYQDGWKKSGRGGMREKIKGNEKINSHLPESQNHITKKLKVDSGKWKVQEQISPWPI